jgi:ABC-type branched-subunit amino acid transport system substrate-binding protein
MPGAQKPPAPAPGPNQAPPGGPAEMPSVAGPGPGIKPPGDIQFPFEPPASVSSAIPTAPGAAPGAAKVTAAVASSEGLAPQAALGPEMPWPSFAPYLNRLPAAEAGAETIDEPGALTPEPRSTVPLPASKDIVRVALLLPLTGPNAGLGSAMLNAAQLAMFNFADQRFELLTHDTKGTPRGAADAAQLAIGDGAEMILGPLLASSTRAVSAKARAANVPVVAFSSDRSVAGGGTYTMGFLPSAEIKRIVAFARTKGVRRFAALAPDNVYGETVIRAFRAAVAANGGTIARVQFYDPFTTDFTDTVRTLANYGSRRQALLGQRKELAGREDEVSRRALKRLERLQTIGELPFDALLLADGGKRLLAIAALLPFYDIDPKKVKMLGTGQWDAPGLGAEPALIGGWFAAPPPTARTDFVNTYKSTYGRTPPRLATLAYDATALAAVLARSEKGPGFSAAAITVPSGFWGRDGIFRFLPGGVAERGLAVMKVGRNGAEIISRAPETFQAAAN